MGKRMRLVHFHVNIDFAEEARSPSPAEKVFHAITGAKPVTKAPKVGMDMKNERAKSRIEWKPEGCKIELEDVPSVEHCVETVLSQLSRIDGVAPIGKASGILVVTNWLLPAPNHDFGSLERKYRETMTFGHEFLWRNAFDSSVVIDSKIDDCILHHQSGAMEPTQLAKDYLTFKLDNVPRVFLFLLTGIRDGTMLEYSRDNMRERLTWLLNQCKSHSDAFAQIWEGVL